MPNQSDLIKERDKKLAEIRHGGEETEVERRAWSAGLPYLNLSTIPIDRDNINLISKGRAESAGLIVIRKDKNKLRLGLLNQENKEAITTLEELKKKFKIEIYLISQTSFSKALKEYAKVPLRFTKKKVEGEVTLDDLGENGEIKTFSSFKDFLKDPKQKGASAMLEIALSSALVLGASDIHVEPEEANIKIRLRLDGVLESAGTISKDAYKLLLSRVKLTSGIQLNITDTPQDGRFTVKTEKFKAEARVSVLPGAYGEYIVIRVLNPSAIKLDVKDLGIREDIWQKIKPEIEKPNGIVLVTGPTGSGKTTTLYAFLKYLLKPAVKIITLEDPIEYHLSGISQSQIESKKGFGFADGLRSALRQDPDIILVGEIRDEETASTALNAALTGHFVFSTIHTNDAPGAIPRFLDLNAKPQILASALNAIVAQRLVRRLCEKCRESAKIDPALLASIKKGLENNKEALAKLSSSTTVYKAVGCEECSGTGYKGRVGIFEVLVIKKEIEELIVSSPSHQDLIMLAKKLGFLSMYYDGILRVLEGTTTLEEVERVALALE